MDRSVTSFNKSHMAIARDPDGDDIGIAPEAPPLALPAIAIASHLAPAAAPHAGAAATAFIPGDLVVSVYGNGDGSGAYTDNQAAPITLGEIDPLTGAIEYVLVLPQSSFVNAQGVRQSAISGEYGSSSEGSLSLSADGHSLVIGGYGVNAQAYNAGGAAVYGNAALAQSTSIQGGPYTAVARVVANIGADGSVDTATAVYGIDNTNNIRSVATVDGSSFYISGQGVKGDATQGVFLATAGASAATAIDTSTDTRTLLISAGTLYVSRDSKQGSGGTDNIASYGGLPGAATAPVILPGINKSITLTAAQANTVNTSRIGKSVALSPENFFFAAPDVLYVADSGNPKQGGLGDGGLQKWTFSNGSWSLSYTLSNGLNLVPDTGSAGTTGLIGLTGRVNADGSVSLYATNETIGDLDPTYLYGITDRLRATAPAADERFTVLMTASADTNIRGVAFAPQAACFCPGTAIATPRGEAAIETLRPGDEVLTESGAMEVIWAGARTVRIDRHPDPELVQPVRIAPGALADGVPARALLVSPDHAIALDGRLIAARLLVNDVSITRLAVETCTYHHIELERHAVLYAEGAPCESYRDSGQRHQFTVQHGAGSSPAGTPVPLHAAFAGEAATPDPTTPDPTTTDPAIVGPVWQALAARAGAPAPATAAPGDDVLVWAGGRILALGRIEAGCATLRFGAPRQGAVRIVSDHARPSDTMPWLDDRRRLGMAVEGLQALLEDGSRQVLTLPDDASGWYEAERAAGATWRWSDGAGEIVLPPGCVGITLRIRALPPARRAA